jgi:hypothetical protein
VVGVTSITAPMVMTPFLWVRTPSHGLSLSRRLHWPKPLDEVR